MPSKRRAVWFIGLGVTGLTVRMNTKGNHPECLGERYKEHLKAPSPIFEHQNNTSPAYDFEVFHNICRKLSKSIGREGHNNAQSNQRRHVT